MYVSKQKNYYDFPSMAHLEFGYCKKLLCRNTSKEPCKGTHENFVSYWSAGIIMVILFQASLKIGKINIFSKSSKIFEPK